MNSAHLDGNAPYVNGVGRSAEKTLGNCESDDSDIEVLKEIPPSPRHNRAANRRAQPQSSHSAARFSASNTPVSAASGNVAVYATNGGQPTIQIVNGGYERFAT